MDIILFLVKGAEYEFEVEMKRQRLVAECEDFNTIDAFRYIDKAGQGEIQCHILLNSLLEEIGIECEEDNLILFFQKFDNSEQQVIKYSDFCDAFAPKDDQYLKEIALRVPRNLQLQMSYEEMFSLETREIYRDVWLEHIFCERQTEILRQNLLKNPFFDLQKSFKQIDDRNQGFITP